MTLFFFISIPFLFLKFYFILSAPRKPSILSEMEITNGLKYIFLCVSVNHLFELNSKYNDFFCNVKNILEKIDGF